MMPNWRVSRSSDIGSEQCATVRMQASFNRLCIDGVKWHLILVLRVVLHQIVKDLCCLEIVLDEREVSSINDLLTLLQQSLSHVDQLLSLQQVLSVIDLAISWHSESMAVHVLFALDHREHVYTPLSQSSAVFNLGLFL